MTGPEHFTSHDDARVQHPLADRRAQLLQPYIRFGFHAELELYDAVRQDPLVGLGYHSLRDTVHALKRRTTASPEESAYHAKIVDSATSVDEGLFHLGLRRTINTEINKFIR
jgi:hypothetical protein